MIGEQTESIVGYLELPLIDEVRDVNFGQSVNVFLVYCCMIFLLSK